MKNTLPICVMSLLLNTAAFAQNEIDALRYSQHQYRGTARFTSMAGAFSALGGDFSVLSVNPAGIGIYRKNEFTFTPSFFIQETSSDYKGNSLYDNKANVNITNAGIVLSHYDPDAKDTWKGFMFAFGYNRLNNFHNRISMSGRNDRSSLLDIFASDAAGAGGDTSSMDPFGTQLALDAGAIGIDTFGTVYHPLQGVYGEEQSKDITTTGSMGETFFSFGSNYSDRLYFGITFGIPHVRYNEEAFYSETGDTNAAYGFKSFELNQELRTTGTGFNFKFGMIYKPADWVRVGAALHTPTYYSLHDNWNSDMTVYFSGNTSYKATSPTGLYDYTLTTPMHAITGIGFVIKKTALIGLDYEFVDYPSARLRAAKYKFLSENKAIRAKYAEGNNIRLGAEWRMQPLSLRAGVAYYSSPFKHGTGNDGSRTDYTAGIGFRDKNFFLDFAYVFSQTRDYYYFYDASLADPSVNTSGSSNVLMTLGVKF